MRCGESGARPSACTAAGTQASPVTSTNNAALTVIFFTADALLCWPYAPDPWGRVRQTNWDGEQTSAVELIEDRTRRLFCKLGRSRQDECFGLGTEAR